jgi:hypothetical protein
MPGRSYTTRPGLREAAFRKAGGSGRTTGSGRAMGGPIALLIEVLTHVHGTRANSYTDPSGIANLSAEEPYALM